jgi:histidine phosphotransfer protein HptB
MGRPPDPNSPPATRRRTCDARWTPPEHLLVLASGDEGLIADLIELFKTDIETRLQKMRAALTAGDIPRLRAGAHSIRGSALQVGADGFIDICQTLELASNLTPASRLAELVDCIQDVFDETASAMTLYANSN